MSLINILKRKSKVALFTTPSHLQNFFIFSKFQQFYKYDISEVDSHDPQTALRLAQEKAAKIYGTKSTHFLTNGSTSGIIAAILATVKSGEKVLIWDKAHQSHFNAVKLAGAIPIFYSLEKDKNWGIYNKISPEKIEETLLNNLPPKNKLGKKADYNQGAIKAVIVTSPSYEGIISDIKSIKKVCEKYGTYLIVDEAHGALYPFCDKLPESAIYQGADFIIQSLHKTAGGLNPTALLHCNTKLPSPLAGEGEVLGELASHRNSGEGYLSIQQTLDMITTTSPSYPLLASIEKNINYLNSKKGRAKILELLENIENMKKNIPNCEFYGGKCYDPTKILIKHKNYTGEELSEFLFKNYIEDEKTNDKSTMLLCGIGTDLKKLQRLEKVLKKIR